MVYCANRLENNRKRNAASRRNETDEQRESCQNYDRLTPAHNRENESLERYNAQVAEDREHHSESCISEINEQRMKRLNPDQQ